MTDRAFANVLEQCLGIRTGEEVVLLVDSGSDPRVVERLVSGIEERGAVPIVAELPTPMLPGEEPPRAVGRMLLGADAAIELTSLFIGSSQARQEATRHGVRYLAMPGIVLDTFRAGGPLDVDFDALRSSAEAIGKAWTQARRFRLATPGGTDLTGSVDGRPGRVLHGIARSPGAYMAPPDIEAGTAPVEGTANGVVVIDADLLFMGKGPLDEPVRLEFVDGLLAGIDGSEATRLSDMLARCNDDRMRNLAEVSIGLNPAGRVCSVPMETESAIGTAHIALGNSIAYGGVVDAVAHLDCVMRDATLTLDDEIEVVGGTVR